MSWTKCSDKLPPECKLVLAVIENSFKDLRDYALIYHDEKDWCDRYGNYFFNREVVCWQSLPEITEEEGC